MTDREKLITLIGQEVVSYFSERIADLLIANGVTVQDVPDTNVGKWIPVTERLPEKQADVLLYFGGKYKNMATGFWHGEEKINAVYWCAYTDDGFYTDCDYKPTHWMPLPEAPKEIDYGRKFDEG